MKIMKKAAGAVLVTLALSMTACSAGSQGSGDAPQAQGDSGNYYKKE